ncbi:Alpha/Beta hydrolase fold [Rhodotorula toruloides]|nr:Alpha/Beta hydrolase fold [Rhodotorula toruloides]
MRLPAFLRPAAGHLPLHSSNRSASRPMHVLGDSDDEDGAGGAYGRRDRDEATIPLTSLDPDDPDSPSYPPSSSSKRLSSRSSSPLSRLPTRRILAILVVIVGLYKLARHAYAADYGRLQSKLDEYSARYNPWHPQPIPIQWVDVEPVAAVKGRRYRAHKEREDDRYWGWKALPYAQPPLGERRFRVALPLEEAKGDETREQIMDEWNEGCVRPRPREDRMDGEHEHFDGHEDCLKINVFSPVQRPNNTLLPVMLWIHGGGFVGGSSGEEKYNPRGLMHRAIDMEQPFVFASINYRLGALGLTASPPEPGPPPVAPHIPVQAPTDLDLNVAFKDQLQALRWIHEHIEQFGGDKDKVVMVGHSAGAMSVGLHLLYSGNMGLFRGAFMLSGAPTSFPVPWPHDASARTLHPLPGPAQCPSPIQREHGPPRNDDLLACLRKLPIEKLYQATRTLTDDSPSNAWFPYYPVLEGEWGTGEGMHDAARGSGGWLNVRPSERINRGDYNKVPVVLGSVLDEGTRFVHPKIGEGVDEFLEVVKDVFDFTYGAVEDILEPILNWYPADPSFGSPFQTGNETFGLSRTYKRLSAFLGDILFQAPRRHLLRETPKDFGEDSWNYLYLEPREGAEPRLGIQHGADLPAWFGNPEGDDEPMVQLSWEMTGYLINFVNRLNPNGAGLPRWPQYGMDRLTLQFARSNTTIVSDSERLETLRFLNINNPIFAR